MTAPELRATTSLAAIFALRMPGLFMIMPAFSPTRKPIPSSDNVLLGRIVGGWLLKQGGPNMVFLICAGVVAVWLAIAFGMKPPVRRT
ncbi:membrane protein [Burkholderia metallica]|nr:membrane protein [Burkholderia metallica]